MLIKRRLTWIINQPVPSKMKHNISLVSDCIRQYLVCFVLVQQIFLTPTLTDSGGTLAIYNMHGRHNMLQPNKYLILPYYLPNTSPHQSKSELASTLTYDHPTKA